MPDNSRIHSVVLGQLSPSCPLRQCQSPVQRWEKGSRRGRQCYYLGFEINAPNLIPGSFMPRDHRLPTTWPCSWTCAAGCMGPTTLLSVPGEDSFACSTEAQTWLLRPCISVINESSEACAGKQASCPKVFGTQEKGWVRKSGK